MIETAPAPLPIDCRGPFICARTGLQTPSDSNNTTMAVANTRNGRLIPSPLRLPALWQHAAGDDSRAPGTPYGCPVVRPAPGEILPPRVYPYLRFLYDTAKRDEPSDAPPLPLRPRPPAHPGRAAAPPPSGAAADEEGGRPAGRPHRILHQPAGAQPGQPLRGLTAAPDRRSGDPTRPALRRDVPPGGAGGAPVPAGPPDLPRSPRHRPPALPRPQRQAGDDLGRGRPRRRQRRPALRTRRR